ncbi:MAG TPA: response regulator [Blastocatellia bacterium]|nr:response regulator [Blastocatellia bacterium]
MKRILVVEDDFDTLNPLSELLRLKGYDVITASEVDIALMEARAERPDLIVTDIALPGKSGLQFISSVRCDDLIRSTPIIVISGCGPVVLLEAANAGANLCLEKPIDIDRLWAALSSVFGQARNLPFAEEPSPAPREQPIAVEIDQLVEQLRRSTSKDEREDYLKRLKTRILELQGLKSDCAV